MALVKRSSRTVRPTLLLVDDDEIFLALAEASLTQSGFQVVAATDALAALAAIEKLPVLDCIVSDLWLPRGTPQGVVLARMIEGRFPGVPRVFVSGDIMAKDHVGQAPLFIKPVDFAALADTVRALCRRARK